MASLTATGVLSAGAVILFGFASIVHTGSGALAASPAAVTGAGDKSDVGRLYASPATSSGSGFLTNVGRFGADTATLSGAGILFDHGSAVALTAAPATTFALGSLGFSGTGVLVATTGTAVGLGAVPRSGTLVATVATLSGAGAITHAGVSALIAAPGTALGTGTHAIPGIGTLVAADAGVAVAGDVSFQGQIPFNPALTFVTSSASYLTLPFAPSLSVLFQYSLKGQIPFQPTLTSAQRVVENPNASLEAAYELTGARPSFPTLVYALDMTTASQIDLVVPVGASFLVSPLYVGGAGDPLFDGGAGSNTIGTRLRDSTSSPSYYIFRQPREFEVVWVQPIQTLYRYTLNRTTGTWSWVKYLSMPERAWAGQYVGSMFDPDNVYDYYCRILGAVYWRLSYDTDVLQDQLDPQKCSTFYLPTLAAQYGLDLDFSLPISSRRSLVANAIPVFKKKSLAESVRLRLQTLGFRGLVREIWINPENAANASYQPLSHINANGSLSCSPTGAGVDFYDAPPSEYNEFPTNYFLSSRVAVYVTKSDGSPLIWTAALKDQLNAELRTDILPVHVDIRFFGTIVDLPVFATPDLIGVSDSLTVGPV